MKRKIYLLPILAVVLVLCGGCSKMVSLTEQEANTIALYSTQIVSKYSRASTPGLGVPEPEEISAQESSGETNEPPAESKEENNKGSEENGEDAKKKQENANSTDGEAQDSYSSFSDAVGISGLTVEYAGYEVTNSITEGSYFSMDASEGKKFVVISLNVENTSADTLSVNVLEMEPHFRITVNEEIQAMAEITLLENDFNTTVKDFASGESMTAQLVFEIDADVVDEISSLTMNVTLNGENSKINLL